MNRTLIVIPAFNEELVVRAIARAAKRHAPGADVVVIDDGSTDDTGSEARKAGATVLVHPFNLGYGAALQTGFKYALARGYEHVVQMDADGQHDPRSIPVLLDPVRRGAADVALGSRFLGAGSYRPTKMRALAIRVFARVASLIVRRKVTDPTSGFQALNRHAVRFYASDEYPADFPDADVLVMLAREGISAVEVPAVMHPRRAGQSMHAGLRPLYYVFKMCLSMLAAMLRPRSNASTAQLDAQW